MENLFNCTGKFIRVYDQNGDLIVFPPSGQTAKVEKVYSRSKMTPFSKDSLYVGDHFLFDVQTAEEIIYGLPDPKEGVCYIVNQEVARYSKREDLIFPVMLHDQEDGLEYYAGFCRIKRKELLLSHQI